MKLTPVQSSQINAIGYEPATKVLRIEFKPGSLYEYANVPQEVYDAFAAAPSIGSHFYKHIKPFKDKYPYVRLEDNKAVEVAKEPEGVPGESGAGATFSLTGVAGEGGGSGAVIEAPTDGPQTETIEELVGDARGEAADAREALDETQPIKEHERPGGGGL